MEKFGDAAPTQGEVIQLLGQLHGSNLLQGNLAPDSEELFRRYRRRARREVKGLLTKFLSLRIPLLDPDRFLDQWVGLFGRFFSGYGVLLWIGLVGAGLWSLAGHTGALASRASEVLSPGNLPLLYAALAIVKILHEMGHAFSCKHFGKQSGAGGEVHRMGVTFLVFTPVPYVDASSSWALRDKRHRLVVGAAGMLVELAIASVAAILWTRTAELSAVHALAYNIMFVAGVSTLLFNGNPFLRYDAYYMLLDVLEIPNLDSRSRSYASYLIKRYVWGVRNALDPSHTKGEKGWLAFYALASAICRVFVFSAIILFVGSRFFALGALMALILLTTQLLPLGRMIRYLATGNELTRVRGRAALTTLVTSLTLLFSFSLIHMPDRYRIEGVVEPLNVAVVHMKTGGFVHRFLPSGTMSSPEGPPVIEAFSPETEAKQDKLLAELRLLQVRRQSAQTRETAEAQFQEEKIAALKEQIQQNTQDLEALALRSPIPGMWIAPDIERIRGKYLHRGQAVGLAADLDSLRIRAVAGQTVASQLIRDAAPVAEIRVKGRPDIQLTGTVEKIIPAGQEQLPSAALGYAAGGSTQTDMKDPSGKKASEPFFEILVIPSPRGKTSVLPGQTVVLRFETSSKTLMAQGWRALLQVFQRRFQI